MEKRYLLTAFSEDRPGLVADITQVIFENGYNLEDTSMTYLGGEFAILLMVTVPPTISDADVMATLSSECRRLEREKNITAYIRPIEREEKKSRADFVEKIITVEGVDQAGIVYKVSKYLSDSTINIRTLDSKVRQSPQSGEILYEMTINVEIPKSLSLQKVEDGLTAIGDHLHVDISFQ